MYNIHESPYKNTFFVFIRITTTVIVQYIILQLHKARQPQSEAFDTGFFKNTLEFVKNSQEFEAYKI